MKTVLLASISLNGQIILSEKSEHQIVAEPVTIDFIQRSIAAGSIIIGRATYELMMGLPEGKQAFSGVEVVMLSNESKNTDDCVVVSTPEEAISYLESKGFEEVIIGGGTQTYNAFLTKGLVTNLQLNLVPIMIGDGGIIGSGNLVTQFKLVEQNYLAEDVIQLSFTKLEK